LAQKFRSVRVYRQGPALYFRFSGEDADYTYHDSITEKWAEDGETLYGQHDPKHPEALPDGYRVISHWACRHQGEIAEDQRLQARVDAKARRERQEAATREAALAEAERLRGEAKASVAAAKAAEARAKELEAAQA